MGESRKTEKSVMTATPYDPAKPAIDQSISGVQSWLSDPSSFAAYNGGMSDWTQQGLGNLAASSGANQSRDYLSDVLGGKYINAGNPYQSDLDASIRAAVMPSINSTFSQAGMSGSTAHQGALMQGLTSGLAAPRYQNYQSERANQQQAAGLLPDVDNLISQNRLTAGQTSEAYDRAKFEEQRLAGLRPYLETAPLLQGYGKMGGTQTGTTTTTSKTPVGETLLGAGMTGLGMMTGMPQIGMMGTGVGLIGGGMRPDYSKSIDPSLPWSGEYASQWPYTITR